MVSIVSNKCSKGCINCCRCRLEGGVWHSGVAIVAELLCKAGKGLLADVEEVDDDEEEEDEDEDEVGGPPSLILPEVIGKL